MNYDELTDEQLYEIEDFLAIRCWRITEQPLIANAIREILARLPEDELDVLVCERGITVIFPERYVNTVYKHFVPFSIGSSINKEIPEIRMKETWFVVLADYLNNIDHKTIVGTIVHEFAHVYLSHFGCGSGNTVEMETMADELASKWGFRDEIEKSTNCCKSEHVRDKIG